MNSYNSRYRPEIDGLRAFSVLSVVAFHVSPSWLKGGFVGVDIFFVISGFLITSHIFENLEKGKFSFIDFWGRRIRRIFPALILILVSSLIAGWFLLFTDEYVQLSKHVSSAAMFVLNFVLASESGYFDNAVITKPLLHLWSLAIEEQFYIIWPFVIWVAWKCKFNLLTVTVIAVIASLYFSLQYVHSNPVQNFFWPFGRFWELLSGSILAWMVIYKNEALLRMKIWVDSHLVRIFYIPLRIPPPSQTKICENLMSFCGWLMLFYAVFLFNDQFPFPSLWTLIPVVAALLVIFSGSKALLNRIFLMNPIAIWIGLVSYPLYLWHWPILSFFSIVEGGLPDRNVRIGIVIISLLLASLTYLFIEKPLRRRGTKPIVTIALLISLIGLGVVGYWGSKSEKKTEFIYRAIHHHHQFFNYIVQNFFECENKLILETSPEYSALNMKRCYQTKQGDPDVLIIGDSHGENLFIGLAETLPNHNIAYNIVTFPSIAHKGDAERIEIIFNNVLKSKKPKYVILVDDTARSGKASAQFQEGYRKHFDLTISALLKHGHKVALIEDIPMYPKTLKPSACVTSRLLERISNIRFSDNDCFLSYDTIEKQRSNYVPILKDLSKKYNIPYVAIADFMCCSVVRDGSLLYRDNNHLTIYGSRLAGSKVAKDLLSSNFFD